MRIEHSVITILCGSLVFFTSCEKSDEQLREDLVGTWKSNACSFPHSINPKDVNESSPIYSYMTFYADGRMTESGDRAYCTLDSCHTDTLPIHCRCHWTVVNGALSIESEGSTAGFARLRTEYPILCIDDDLLVFDNVEFAGRLCKKACFERQ
jgi:hypothetical protein